MIIETGMQLTTETDLNGYPADQATLIPLVAANFRFIRERIV